jgi:hypothetical protein
LRKSVNAAALAYLVSVSAIANEPTGATKLALDGAIPLAGVALVTIAIVTYFHTRRIAAVIAVLLVVALSYVVPLLSLFMFNSMEFALWLGVLWPWLALLLTHVTLRRRRALPSESS